MRNGLVLAMAAAAVLAGGACFGEVMAPATGPGTQEAPATGAGTQGAGIPKALAERMDEWIGLLKAGKDEELFESCLSPEVLAQMTQPPTTMSSGGPPPTVAEMKVKFEKIVDEFRKDRAPAMLKELEAARTETPTLNADGTKARFAKGVTGRMPPLRFKKVGETWYVDGH